MRTYYESDIRRRTLYLALGLWVWFLVILFELIHFQVLSHGRLKAVVVEQNQNERTVRPPRGDIYDRNGALLACSVPAASVFIRPNPKESPAEEASKVRKLQAALGLAKAEADKIRAQLRAGKSFIFVKRQISDREEARVRALDLPNVDFEMEPKRFYPKRALAGHVLGGVNRDGKGSGGIESLYEDVLAGSEGKQIVFRDRRQVEYQTIVLTPPVAGRDLTLTIDETIQYIAEKELFKAVRENRAAWGTVVVLDPFSGDILAMASSPPYDPNDLGTELGIRRNRAVLENFEPGSTFKIVAAATALEKGAVRFSDVFDCRAGSILVGSKPITDHVRMGLLTFPQVLIESSNVGTAQFAMRLDRNDFYDTIRKFGFGEKTGVELPGEQRGLVRAADEWNPTYSLPHIAIGYEVMTTALQVLRAMNVYATRGWLVRPRIVKAAGPDSRHPQTGPSESVRIMDGSLASEMVTRVFEKVVEEGTAETARLEGYGMAGKTGTARKYDQRLRRYTLNYVASFVGFAPVDRPVLSMIVVLDDPKKENFYYGGKVAAPVFRDIARQVLRYLKVPPEKSAKDSILAGPGGEGTP